MKKYKVNIHFAHKNIVKGSFSLGNHGIYLLKGPVGSGKTSILREIYFKAFCRHKISYSTLDFPFESKIRVKDFIAKVANATSIDKNKLESLLFKFNIYNLLDNDVDRLSDGEKSRLLISLSIAQTSNIVLLDEPSSRLDKVNVDRLIEILKEEQDQRVFVIASHRDHFDDFSSGIIQIVDGKIHSNIDQKYEDNTSNNQRTIKSNKKPPISRLYKYLSRTISAFFLMICAASLIPVIEYIAPTESNFYRGRKDNKPIRFERLDKNWNDDLLVGVTAFDFYVVPKYFNYTLKGKLKNFSIETLFPSSNFLFFYFGSFPYDHIVFEAISDKDFGISKDLFKVFQSIHPDIDYTDIEVGGLFCKRLIDEPGLFIEYPEKFIQNIRKYNKPRYVTPEDVILDTNLKQIELKNYEMAISYSTYMENPSIIGSTINDCKVVGYLPFSQIDVFQKSYDYHADQIRISGGYSIYSRSNTPPPNYEKYFEIVDDYMLLKNKYREYLKEYCFPIPLIIGSSSFIISLIIFAIASLLEDIKKQKDRELFLFYNNPTFAAVRSLSVVDLLPVFLNFLSILLFTPLIIRTLFPLINLGFSFVISFCMILIFTLLCTVISLIINSFRQRRLR